LCPAGLLLIRRESVSRKPREQWLLRIGLVTGFLGLSLWGAVATTTRPLLFGTLAITTYAYRSVGIAVMAVGGVLFLAGAFLWSRGRPRQTPADPSRMRERFAVLFLLAGLVTLSVSLYTPWWSVQDISRFPQLYNDSRYADDGRWHVPSPRSSSPHPPRYRPPSCNRVRPLPTAVPSPLPPPPNRSGERAEVRARLGVRSRTRRRRGARASAGTCRSRRQSCSWPPLFLSSGGLGKGR